ncbi:MAG: NUDIX hydrolase [Caldilineaceae bacterium]|nr:NUDIX hydrolase [Caldilineaceae bacterium]
MFARDPIPSYFFVWVVVRRADEFLLVQENLADNPWFLPAGMVEPGESLIAAAHRETMEEAGIAIRLEGIIEVRQQVYAPDIMRIQVLFLALPLDDTPPKSTPDEHTLRAAWFKLDELTQLHHRSARIPELLAELAAGRPVYPPEVLVSRGLEEEHEE